MRRRRRTLDATLIVASLMVPAPAAAATQASCSTWSDELTWPLPGVDGEVYALAVFDDGTGPALYVGGAFRTAGTAVADGLARWDGARWSAVGGGLRHPEGARVEALHVWDDGTGPALHVGGRFHGAGGASARNVARWDGTGWSGLGAGLRGDGDTVMALAAFDDGGGERLYAGGYFRLSGDRPAERLARWDGGVWTEVGGGITGAGPTFVAALATYDGGAGPELYVAGRFRGAGGAPATGIARWSGTGWADVGSGVSGPGFGGQGMVRALLVWDDGGGADLYAAGEFARMDGVLVGGTARWDGSAWSALGPGFLPPGDGRALAVHDDGGGECLYVGAARCCYAPGGDVPVLGRWDGASWSTVGWAELDVRALAAFDEGRGERLFAGGSFGRFGDGGDPVMTQGLARVASAGPSSVGPTGQGLLPTRSGARMWALEAYDAGTGPELYAAGSFFEAVGSGATSIARWDGTRWACLPGAVCRLVGPAYELEAFDPGGGAQLCIGGSFRMPGTGIENLARWDGATWRRIPGWSPPVVPRALRALELDGSRVLVVTGEFATVGGVAARRIAVWDGTGWAALGPGLDAPANDAIVFDDGGGPVLFAGGQAVGAGGSVARWEGTSWDFPGGGAPEWLYAFAVVDDGSGPSLYAGGGGPTEGPTVVRWNGAAWDAVGSPGDWVSDLVVHDDGAGPRLYAAFRFGGPDGASGLARLEGAEWVVVDEVGGPGTPSVLAFEVLEDADGGRERLFMAGSFHTVGDVPSILVAELEPTGAAGCPNGTGVPFCTGAAPSAACPCGNGGAVGRGCAHAQNPDGARLTASGDPAARAVALHVDGLSSASPTAVLVRSRATGPLASGTPFGDGLLCVGAPAARLAARRASGGRVDFAVQHGAGAGAFDYQVLFRSFAPGFCSARHVNLTNGFRVRYP